MDYWSLSVLISHKHHGKLNIKLAFLKDTDLAWDNINHLKHGKSAQEKQNYKLKNEIELAPLEKGG